MLLTPARDSPMLATPDPAVKTPNSETQPAARLSEKARNRENQRRLRARRKGYTEELDRRLRKFEQEGVRATEVVQKAARIVAEENKLLRRLLNNNGISSTAIDDFVRSTSTHSEKNSRLLQRVPPASAQPSPLPHVPVTEQSARAKHGRHRLLKSRAELESPPEISAIGHTTVDISMTLSPVLSDDAPAQGVLTPVYSAARGDGVVLHAAGATATSEMTTDMTCPTPHAACRRVGVDEMDCEDAARIISSLRGGQDPQAVWPELGCSSANRTRVKNAYLMSLAD